MARPSRKERQRREKIAAGMRRYWKRVRRVEKVAALPTKQARARLRAIPEGTFTRAIRQLAERRESRAVDLTGEYAFNLQDADQIEDYNLYSHFRGQDEVTIQVSYEYQPTVGGSIERGERTLTFVRGESEEKFWSNYFAAVREYHDSVQGGRSYERFAFYVNSAA